LLQETFHYCPARAAALYASSPGRSRPTISIRRRAFVEVATAVAGEVEKGLHLHHHLSPRRERAMFATLGFTVAIAITRGITIGPVISREAKQRIERYITEAEEQGAKVLVDGRGVDKPGFWVGPTLIDHVRPEMRIAQEEIFGPTTALIPVADLDEAISVSNGIKYGLSSSIFTQDVNAAFRAMRDLEAGITYVNAGKIGAEVPLPFGGTKDTGNGHREAGQAALDVFTEWKSIYVDYSGRPQRAQIDTEP